MQSATQPEPVSKTKLWAGIIVSAIPSLFLLFDGVMKLVKPAFVVDSTVRLGYPESVILGLGIVLTASTVVYLIPRAAVLGAITVDQFQHVLFVGSRLRHG